MEKQCPMVIGSRQCMAEPSRIQTTVTEFQCQFCKRCEIDDRLVRAPSTITNWGDMLGAVRESHVLSQDAAPRVSINNNSGTGKVRFDLEDDSVSEITVFPRTVNERASRLLSSFVAMSSYFGHELEVVYDSDFPLAYANGPKEFRALLRYLEQSGYVELRDRNIGLSGGKSVVATAAGFHADATNRIAGPITVFISSTVYDLVDCRAELAAHLESLGGHVRASEDPKLFDLPDEGHSIDSCLFNVERSDLVLCIIDRRYGATLDNYGHPGKSATEVEVEHAQKIGVPVQFYIRDRAFSEFGLMKKAEDAGSLPNTHWVEPKNDDAKLRWVQFVRKYTAPSQGEPRNNWVDQFSSIVDLKQIVERRIRSFRRSGRFK